MRTGEALYAQIDFFFLFFWLVTEVWESDQCIKVAKQHRSNQISCCCSLYLKTVAWDIRTQKNMLIKLRDSRAVLLSSIHTLPEQISEIIKRYLKSLDTTWEGQYFLSTLDKCLPSRFLKSPSHSLFIKDRKWTKTGDILWKGPWDRFCSIKWCQYRI